MYKFFLVYVVCITFFCGCVSQPSIKKDVPVNVTGLELSVRKFDGRLMDQPVGVGRLNGSDYVLWINGQAYSPFLALDVAGKRKDKKIDNFYKTEFKPITDDLLKRNFSSKVEELSDRTNKYIKIELSTYGSVGYTSADKVEVVYFTNAVMKEDGKKIWQSFYFTLSDHKTLSDLSSSSEIIYEDAKNAVENNVSLFLEELEESGLFNITPPRNIALGYTN